MYQIRALRKLTIVQTKLYLREPVSVFFTLLFAPLMLIMMGFVFGNSPESMFGGRGQLENNVPAYAAIIIGVVGLITVPIGTAGRREAGLLRRFRATPLRPLTYFTSDVLVYFAMTMLGILLLFLLGKIAYDVQFKGNLLMMIAGICLSAFAFLSMGYVLAGVAPNARVAAVIGNVLFFPMMFLSGTTLPLEVMPEAVRNVSRFIPLTHVVTLLRGLWFGESLSEHLVEIAVLGGVLVVGTIIATRAFRWE